ncbi:MAG: (5-formylfuran-3-yl)methyl phosphate synthase [Methanobacteriaceae archaeon]|nr:(5-formylfuran-3-yl)methyl phosphate synthase [Methanobacteriaceae archaeon]
MELLVSAINTKEALDAIEGQADIIDVKNPKEGSLGANFPWIIKEISKYTENKTLSATIGDAPYKPGTMSLAALGCAISGANYIKTGLYGTKNKTEAIDLMKNINRSVKDYNSDAIVVTCGYADAKRISAVKVEEIIDITLESNSDIAMLDTAIKDGKTLFDHQTLDSLTQFIEKAHDHSIKVALAGSVNLDQIKQLNMINCDIVGVRTAVCDNGNRNTGSISPELVKNIKQNII